MNPFPTEVADQTASVADQVDVRNVPDMLAMVRERAATSPDREVFVDFRVRDARSGDFGCYSPERVTAGDFWRQVTQVGAGFRQAGVGTGDVVAVQLPNRHEFAVVHLALHAIGAITMPVSPIYRSRDLGRMLRLSSSVGVVVPERHGEFDYLDMAAALRDELPDMKYVFAVSDSGSAADGVLTIQDLQSTGLDDPEQTAVVAAGHLVPDPDSAMLVNFTSGTTGEPKGVVHSFRTISAAVTATIERLGLCSEDVSVVAPTLGHAAGFLNGIHMAYFIGHRVVYLDQWDPAVALRVLASERATYAPVMPPYLVDLLAQPDFDEFDLSAWRTARVSGGPIPRAALARLSVQQPQLRLCPGWGMSEALYVTCAGPDDDEGERHESDGRAVGTCEIEIRDTFDESRVLPVGEIGHIFIKAPSMMLGYFGRPELTQSCYSTDGWYRSGDLGSLRHSGFLSIKGRIKDLVVRGGENVPVLDVEFLLTEHPDIVSAVVVGVPDERLGERVCAVITLRDGAEPLTVEQLRTYLDRRGLTRQFMPEYLVLAADLPRTTTGKIIKSAVKDAALIELRLDDASQKESHS